MRIQDRVSGSALAGILALAGVGHASAQATQSVSQSINAHDYPGAFIARPVNLRAAMVRIDTRYQHSELVGAGYGNQLAVGVAVGLNDAVEIGVTHVNPNGIDAYDEGGLVANLRGGGSTFGNVNVYGRMRILDAQDFGLSAQLAVVFPVHGDGDWQVGFGLPLRARVAPRFALDMVPELRVRRVGDGAGGHESQLDLNIPVSGVLQVTNNVWLAGRSGMYWQNFNDIYFPGLLEVGFSVDHAGAALLDLAIQGGFPTLFAPNSADAVITEYWVLRVNLTGFLAF